VFTKVSHPEPFDFSRNLANTPLCKIPFNIPLPHTPNFPRHVFSDINSDVGANNRYCSDNGPGVGSDESVSNKIMCGRKVRLCLSGSHFKYWLDHRYVYNVFCASRVRNLKNLPLLKMLKRFYSRRGVRCFIKLRFRELRRVAWITTNFLCLFRSPVSAFHKVIVPYLERGNFQVFVFLYIAGTLHLFNSLLLCFSFSPAAILTTRVVSNHTVTITHAFCNKSDILSEWATRIW
jgi:hypothetical protein